MAERLSGRWLDSQGYCGVRDFDEPQVVESRICGAGIGFRLVNNGLLGVGLPVVLGAEVGGF